MFDSMFTGLDKIGRGLDASWTKNEVISSNIANVDTPGYKKKKAVFGDLLNEELSSSLLKTSHERHMQIDGASSIVSITTDMSTTNMRTDENNVNIDEEMSDLAKNQIYYNVLTQRATGEINKLRSAIQDA